MPAKAFACIRVTILYTLYGSGLLAQGGGGGVQQPQIPGPKPIFHKMHFLPNKKLMTVMKFSRTNLLNCFVFYASLIYCAYRLKVELARFMHFFHKKKSHSDLMTHFLQMSCTIYLHARELFMFFFIFVC